MEKNTNNQKIIADRFKIVVHRFPIFIHFITHLCNRTFVNDKYQDCVFLSS